MQPTPPRRTGRSSPNEDDDVELAPSSLPVDEPQSPSPSSFSPRSSSPHASTSSPTKTKPPEQSLYSPRTDLEAHSLLLVLSVLGCLIRLGLNALFAYPGQEVFALVWAQGVGCLVMGVCVARKEEIERWVGKGWYAGLGTGLCGSITTFSSWMLQTFEQFSNLEDVQGRTGVHDTLAGLTHLLITLSFSLFSFHLGLNHLAPHLPSFPPHPSSHPRITPLLRWSTLLLPPASYLALLLLAILAPHRTDRTLLLTLLFAPFGTWARYHLGLWLNPVFSRASTTQDLSPPRKGSRRRTRFRRPTKFPILGTLTANLLATFILALCFLLQRLPSVRSGTSKLSCQVEQAIEDGLCGSLSTVSTLVAELVALAGWRRRGTYLGLSVGLGLGIVVIVVGGGSWGRGRGLGKGCAL